MQTTGGVSGNAISDRQPAAADGTSRRGFALPDLVEGQVLRRLSWAPVPGCSDERGHGGASHDGLHDGPRSRPRARRSS
jgi:hypothetical protein